jgi:hypothetical protein
MTAPGDATVGIWYRAACPRCPEWQPEYRTSSEDAHTDRRLHNLTHITSDIRKGGGKR